MLKGYIHRHHEDFGRIEQTCLRSMIGTSTTSVSVREQAEKLVSVTDKLERVQQFGESESDSARKFVSGTARNSDRPEPSIREHYLQLKTASGSLSFSIYIHDTPKSPSRDVMSNASSRFRDITDGTLQSTTFKILKSHSS